MIYSTATENSLIDLPRREPNKCVSAGIVVLVLLLLSTQLQHFLQQYKTESKTGLSPTVSVDGHPTITRQEFSGDFRVYYTASLIARHRGEHVLYYVPKDTHTLLIENVPLDTLWSRIARAAGFQNTMHFIYPPFAALLLQPLSLVKWQTSLLVWRVVLVSLVLVSIYLSLVLQGRQHLWFKFGVATAAAFSFFPLTETLMEGQIDPLILLSWVGGIYFIKKQRPFWSALLFALGTMVKISPAIVVGLFLLRRQGKWLLNYAGSLIGLHALAIWRLGWENHTVFIKQVLPILSCGIASLANKSLAGFIYDIYLRRVPVDVGPPVPYWLCVLIKVIAMGLYSGVLLYFWRRNKTASMLDYELVTLALVTLIASPVSWRHHYLLALLPLIYLWNSTGQKRSDVAVLVIATLAIGTVLPDYTIARVDRPVLQILLASIVPISTMLLLWVLCANQSRRQSSIGDEAGGGKTEELTN
jgi:hypothetical protein